MPHIFEPDRDIPVPTDPFPTIMEGQKLLSISPTEWKILYENVQSLLRAYNLGSPPQRHIRHGLRVENHAALVLPLEATYPILRRCKENWGVKWIIKKAKHAVALKYSCDKRRERQKEKEMGTAAVKAVEAGMVSVREEEEEEEEQEEEQEQVEETHKRVFILPHRKKLPRRVVSESLFPVRDEGQKACAAMFHANKAWLVSGPPVQQGRYVWKAVSCPTLGR